MFWDIFISSLILIILILAVGVAGTKLLSSNKK